MTRKEIIQALRCCEKEVCADGGLCPLFSDADCIVHLREAATDLIERLTAENAKAEAERDTLREKQRWIPVTERLPDERDAVIILLKDGQVFRGEIRERIALPEWWYFYDASDTDMDMLGVMYPLFDDGLWLHENPVVAWMPLPESPEEGEKA